MRKPVPLNIDRLFELFYVDSTSLTGLRNLADRPGTRARKDMQAGWINAQGYGQVYIDGRGMSCARVVLAMKTGRDEPHLEADHIDRVRNNNHPFNLRWANRSQQCYNRSPRL